MRLQTLEFDLSDDLVERIRATTEKIHQVETVFTADFLNACQEVHAHQCELRGEKAQHNIHDDADHEVVNMVSGIDDALGALEHVVSRGKQILQVAWGLPLEPAS